MAVNRASLPVAEGINFGDLGMYVAGGGLPAGDYILFFDVCMYQAKNQQGANQGPPRLGVQLSAFPLDSPVAENKKEQFYSMGSNADKSFAPNPETGKGVVAIPGAAGQTLNHSTNWAILLKSLYDSGLPQGIFTNDLSVLDGIHVHMEQQDEPEERKGFQSQTGEAAGEMNANRGPKKIAVVTEIKDDGKPWEGTGGIPEAAPAKPAAKVNGKPAAAKPVAKPAAAAPVPAGADADEDLLIAAQNAVSAVLGNAKFAAGCTRVMLRTQTFAEGKKAPGNDAQANAILKAYFATDDALNELLGPLGYTLVGTGPTAAVNPIG